MRLSFKKRQIISGGAGDDICKRNINDLLLMDFGRKSSGSFDATKFSSDLKKDVTGFKKSISGNWMAMPGPPPKLDCTIS